MTTPTQTLEWAAMGILLAIAVIAIVEAFVDRDGSTKPRKSKGNG